MSRHYPHRPGLNSNTAAMAALVTLAVATTAYAGGEGDKPSASTRPGIALSAEKDPVKRAAALVDQARRQIKENNYNQARESLAQAKAANPKNQDVARLLGEIDQREKEHGIELKAAEARKHVDNASKALKEGKLADARTHANRALAVDSANSKAKDVLRKVAEREMEAKEHEAESKVENLLSAAKQSLDSGKFDAARQSLVQARSAAQGTTAFDKRINKLSGKVDKAEKKARSEAASSQVKEQIAKGREQLKANNFQLARDCADRAYQLDKSSKDVQRLRDDIKAGETKFNASAKDRELAAALKKAEDLAASGRDDEATAAYQSVLKMDSGNKAANKGLEKLTSKHMAARDAAAKQAKSQREAAEKKAAEEKQKATDQKKAMAAKAEADKAQAEKAKSEQAKAEKAKAEKALAEKASAEKAQAEKADKAKKAAEEAKALAARQREEREMAAQKEREAARKAEEAHRAELAAKQAAEREKQAAAEKAKKESESTSTGSKAMAMTAGAATGAAAASSMTGSKSSSAMQAEDEKKAEKATPTPAATPASTPKPTATPRPTPAPTRTATATATPVPVSRSTGDAGKRKEFDELIDKANRQLKAGDYEGARMSTAAASALNVENTKAQAMLDTINRAANDRKKGVFEERMKAADGDVEKGSYDAALEKYKAIDADFPMFAGEVKAARMKAEEKKASAETAAKDVASKKARETSTKLFNEGVALYNDKKLAEARAKWLEAKEADPTNPRPDVNLKETEAAFNQLMAHQQEERNFEEREASAKEKENTLIPISTLEPTRLSEFLNSLRLLSGMDFVIAKGVEAKVEASFQDKPLHEVLDSVLLPIGLKWERKKGTDVIVITPDLRTKVYSLTPDQVNMAESLLQRGTLQKLLYGPGGQPILEGQEIYTDARQNVIVQTDSQQNIDKFTALLQDMKGRESVNLIFRSYVIQEDKAQQVKALLDALLRADDKAPYNPERKLIIEGGEMIIKDTPENIRRVEEILTDRQFLSQIYSNRLGVRTFNLTPLLDIQENPELAHTFGENIKTIVETLLYTQEGVSKSREEGRRLFYDPATLQLTITDYPDNLEAVENFIESLPQIKKDLRNKIIFLNWASATEFSSQVQDFLGQQAESSQTSSNGSEMTKSLRVSGSQTTDMTFRDINIRISKVNENDANDKNDDNVELIVRTGTTSQDLTIEEFRSEFVEDYEIFAEDIKPSSTPGEGRAKIRVRYAPGGQGGQQPAAEATPVPSTAETAASEGFSIVPIENLNAIFVRYQTGNQIRDLEFWAKTLDIPTLQVSLEVKFVEVVETKARELKAEFNIADLTEGASMTDAVIRNRFAKDIDEFTSEFDPMTETTQAANLLKGATIFDLATGGKSPVSLTLRALEAQGVINIVNGPQVTVLNGESATFNITRIFGAAAVQAGGGTINGPGGGSVDVNTNNANVNTLDAVNMEMTPTVTQAGNITINPIDIIVNDFDNNIGAVTTLQNTTATGVTGSTVSRAVGNRLSQVGRITKDLSTAARIKDGGTVVLGGWKTERTSDLDSGVPVLRDIPFVGKFLFNRMQKTTDKITLLIFLTGSVVKD